MATPTLSTQSSGKSQTPRRKDVLKVLVVAYFFFLIQLLTFVPFEKQDVHIISNQEKNRVPPTGQLALRLFLHQVGIANNSKLITSYQSQAVCWPVYNQGQTLNSFNFSSNTCCRLHLFLVINRITINDCSSLIFHWAGFSSTSLPSKNMKKKGKKSPLTRKDSVHEESMEVCSKQSVDG